MRAGSRAALFVLTLTMLALSLATSRLAAAHPETALGGGALWESGVQTVAAVSAVAAGLVLILQRRVIACGVLLALTGPAIALGQVPVPDARSALLFTAALAGGSLAPALAGSTAMTCPVAPMRLLDWSLVAFGLATAAIVQGLLPTSVFDPSATGCFGCVRNLAEVRSDPSLYTSLGHWGLTLTVCWGVGFAIRVSWRWVHAPRVVRTVNAALVLGGAATSAVAAIAAIHALSLATPEIDTALRTYWLLQCGLIIVMSVGVAADGRRARLLAGWMTDQILAEAMDPESLRETIAASVDDPALRLVFRRGDGTLIDVDGSAVSAIRDARAVIQVNRADAAIAEVWYDANLVGASYQLVAVVRAAGLAIEHLAADARLLAELADLNASRLRIVAAGDAERRRLERNLHDGAQQRLIALQVLLHLVSSGAPPALNDRCQDARREIGAALEELRDLAHGIHPVELTDGGLGEGLRTLAETSPVPLTVTGRGSTRHPAAAEAATYRLVADTITTAGRFAGQAVVNVALDDSDPELRVQLTAQGVDPSIGANIVARALDRFVALEGTVTLGESTNGLTIEAMIPCGS